MTPPLAFIIGGEVTGLSIEVDRLHPECITIPMSEEIESLNAAVAAGILLFEAVRQRISN
jgi:tRNA G18 (ribose-2'-O)-methylase SpoU